MTLFLQSRISLSSPFPCTINDPICLTTLITWCLTKPWWGWFLCRIISPSWQKYLQALAQDKEGLMKLKKSVKDIQQSGTSEFFIIVIILTIIIMLTIIIVTRQLLVSKTRQNLLSSSLTSTGQVFGFRGCSFFVPFYIPRISQGLSLRKETDVWHVLTIIIFSFFCNILHIFGLLCICLLHRNRCVTSGLPLNTTTWLSANCSVNFVEKKRHKNTPILPSSTKCS